MKNDSQENKNEENDDIKMPSQPLDDIKMLSQPLTTEDGFLNEACIKELNSTILNMPEAYERLLNDEEWATKRITSIQDITSSFAKCATYLSGYAYPNNLEKMIGYLHACLKRDIDWDKSRYNFCDLSLCDINKLLHDILGKEKDIIEWNTPKKDWRNSEYDEFQKAEEADPDYGFIDIGALFQNVCIEIRKERRSFDAFNKKFDEEWEARKQQEQKE